MHTATTKQQGKRREDKQKQGQTFPGTVKGKKATVQQL